MPKTKVKKVTKVTKEYDSGDDESKEDKRDLPICNCDFDSQIAYILKSLDDEIDDNNFITMSDYLEDDNIQNGVRDKKIFLVCSRQEDLTAVNYKSEKKKSHFRHVNRNHNGEMTEWHKKWQEEFNETEVHIGNRWADAVCGKFVLEFQHSPIKKELVNTRSKNYEDNKKELLWIIDGSDYGLEPLDEKEEKYLITVYNHQWVCDNYVNQKCIYLDINNKIFRIDPNCIKSKMILCKEFKTRKNFIKEINSGKNKWKHNNHPEGTIYFNQRGAGCGKTYESIQIIDKDDRFKNKSYIIYLTKVHSAKHVIYKELNDQYKDGHLTNIEPFEINENDELGTNEAKKYAIYFHNKKTKKDCFIAIGTIDSFIWALNKDSNGDKDQFIGIAKGICNGKINCTKTGGIRYANNENIKLNLECLIVIDEAQDLDSEYIQAFNKIRMITNIDVYIIGDKLQSIWDENNVFTYVEQGNIKNGIEYGNEKNKINIVRRFHNKQFVDMTNTLIDFKKWNLPCVSGICDGKCKYTHEDKNVPFLCFQIPDFKKCSDKKTMVGKVSEVIFNYMEDEIKDNNYLPNNFMFVFPVLSKNYLSSMLEANIQIFWMEKFKDNKYQKEVLLKSKYWKDKLNDGKFYKYSFLHKSDDGRSIDLSESEHSTRLLSIHASKGNGCEVVFLLGVNEKVLTLFSKKVGNLQYDSLFHVSVTRQKKKLYIGFDNSNDDITSKLKKLKTDIVYDPDLTPDISDLKKTVGWENEIVNFALSDEQNYKIIYDKLKIKDYLKYIPVDSSNKKIVDWGHHIIRTCVYFYGIMKNVVNNEKMGDVSEIDEDGKLKLSKKVSGKQIDQFSVILKKMSSLPIEEISGEKYYDVLCEISKKRSKRQDHDSIPILFFEKVDNKSKYAQYTKIFIDIVENIQKKISKSDKIPDLCPLEIVVLLHVIRILDDGIYCDLSAMEVYSIIYYYDSCSDELNNEHKKLGCICTDKFKNNKCDLKAYLEVRESIKNFYEKSVHIDNVYKKYKKYISEKYDDGTEVKYNVSHLVTYTNNDFGIRQKYEIIGYSEKYVFYIKIIPQLTKLNFNDNMFRIIFDNFLLLNSNQDHIENKKRFFGKTIVTCIFTMSSQNPIIFETKISDELCIKNCIGQYLREKYDKLHSVVYDFYMYHKKLYEKKNCVEIMCNALKSHNEKKKMPLYVMDYYDEIRKDLDKDTQNGKVNRKKILDRCENKETFLEEIKNVLEFAIKKVIDGNSKNEDEEW